MNTPAHVLIGAAAFGSAGDRRIMAAAVAGALMPDLSLYALAGTSIYLLGIPPQQVFDVLYFSDAWQTVFAIDNSVFVWAGLLAAALWRGSRVLAAFAMAGLLHVTMDFFLHAGDGRPHFWPLSRWVFDSPVSYWDSSHHALWVAPAAAVLCVGACLVLWRRGTGILARAGFATLLVAELWVARQWLLFF